MKGLIHSHFGGHRLSTLAIAPTAGVRHRHGEACSGRMMTHDRKVMTEAVEMPTTMATRPAPSWFTVPSGCRACLPMRVRGCGSRSGKSREKRRR